MKKYSDVFLATSGSKYCYRYDYEREILEVLQMWTLEEGGRIVHADKLTVRASFDLWTMDWEADPQGHVDTFDYHLRVEEAWQRQQQG